MALWRLYQQKNHFTIIIIEKEIPISKVEEGDLILTNNGYKKVKEVFKSLYSPNLLVNDIETTSDHPFIMENEMVKSAGHLRIGEKLFNGIEVKRLEKISSNKKMCNLEVEGHRYFVKDYLIHDGREIKKN